MEEITDETRKCKILRKELKDYADVGLYDTVYCLHCGQTYYAEEMRVFKKDDGYYVCCKYSPKCTGTIIDIM